MRMPQKISRAVIAVMMSVGTAGQGFAWPILLDARVSVQETIEQAQYRARGGRGGAVTANVNVNRRANVNVNRNVNRRANVNVNRTVNVNRRVGVVRPVRGWAWRPHYGTIIAGVTLGTVIAASAVATVPPAPAPNLCWYWSDASQTRGYWDYC